MSRSKSPAEQPDGAQQMVRVRQPAKSLRRVREQTAMM